MLTPDGTHYVLNGTKQFITNAGFADIFIVFAKIDGDKFTGFIVDRSRPGVTIGPEEHKMGIKGSTTCAIILEDVKVPVEQRAGRDRQGPPHRLQHPERGPLQAGRQHRRRLQDGAEARRALHQAAPAVRPAAGDFGLIRRKIADVAARTSSRPSRWSTAPPACWTPPSPRWTRAAPDYDRTASRHGRGVLDRVLDDQGLRLRGPGPWPPRRACRCWAATATAASIRWSGIYRDERINRIFEGTNEINRMLVPGMILKKALKGELPFFAAAQAVADELTGLPVVRRARTSPASSRRRPSWSPA